MILDANDPTGFGLFSKCARSQASRLRPHRPATAHTPKSRAATEQATRKKSISQYGFEKMESREQRERKYKRDQTPPVGQYNPIRKQAAKGVWDILKVYSQSCKRSRKQEAVGSSLVQQAVETAKESVGASEAEQQQQQQVFVTGSSSVIMPAVLGKMEASSMESITRSQCMVNMSRMTGRKEEQSVSVDWGDSNVMKSLQYVKGTIVKNIYMAKQPKKKSNRYCTINPASTYDYDYKVVKPDTHGLVDFSMTRGREDRKKDCEYSYQHYDYDRYVWSSNSRVYANTKKHLIQFNKQVDRYPKANRENIA